MRKIISALDFQFLPREMLELIWLKSMVGIMSVEWMANVRDNEFVSGSYNLYETVSNKTWMSANISLISVTYQWMRTRYRKRGVVLKQCELDSQKCYFQFFRNLYYTLYLSDQLLSCTMHARYGGKNSSVPLKRFPDSSVSSLIRFSEMIFPIRLRSPLDLNHVTYLNNYYVRCMFNIKYTQSCPRVGWTGFGSNWVGSRFFWILASRVSTSGLLVFFYWFFLGSWIDMNLRILHSDWLFLRCYSIYIIIKQLMNNYSIKPNIQ